MHNDANNVCIYCKPRAREQRELTHQSVDEAVCLIFYSFDYWEADIDNIISIFEVESYFMLFGEHIIYFQAWNAGK